MSGTQYTKFLGSKIKETASAVLFTVDGHDYWFPLSTVNKMVVSTEADKDEIYVADWIAKKKGLLNEYF